MDCRQAEEALSAYLDGALAPDGARGVEEHLAACAGCRSVRDDLVRAGRLVKALDEVEPPPWLHGRIMAEVREDRERRERWSWAWLFALPGKATATVAAVLVAGLAVYLFQVLPPGTARREATPGPSRQAPREPEEQTPAAGAGPRAQAKPTPAPASSPRQEAVPAAPRSAPRPPVAPAPEDLTLAQKAAPAPSAPRTPAPAPSGPGMAPPEDLAAAPRLPAEQRATAPGDAGPAGPSGAAGLPDAPRKGEERLTDDTAGEDHRRLARYGPAPVPAPVEPPGAAGLPAPSAATPSQAMRQGAMEAPGMPGLPVHEFWLRSTDLARTVDAVEALLTQVTGRAAVRADRERSAVLRTVIDAGRLVELRDRLKALGPVREKPVTPEGGTAPLSIRIEIRAEP
jgi:hypothetical protein